MGQESKDPQVFVVVAALIEAAADKDETVREAVTTSLRKLAKKHPSNVLKYAAEYRKGNPKLSVCHLSALLKTMEQICQEHLADIDGDVVLQLITFSVEEMTKSTEYLPASQMPASGILVALGKAHCNEVMGGLLKQFQPGVVPHYSILHTMGSLASANVFGIVPFIKATLGTMLPMIGLLKNDAMKQVFSYALGKFSEAVSEYLANIDHAPDPTVKKEAFASEICIAYDLLANTWIQCREPKVCETVLQAIGPLFSLLPGDKVVEQVPRLVLTLLGLYRRNVDPYPVTQCLATVLLVAISEAKITLEPLLDNLLNIMFELVCTSPDYAQPQTVKNHYEVLRCFDRIAEHFSDRVVELLIQQLKNNNERDRIKALFVITHLVNSSESLIHSRISDLVCGLRCMLAEQSIKVKKVLLKTIVAFAYHGYLEGKDFVEFIVKHCCSQKKTVGTKEPEHLAEELQETCCSTLYLLATTVPQVQDLLWPLLLQFLVEVQYTQACATIARCLAHLAAKKQDSYTDKIPQEVPGPHTVLGRCLALLGNPLESSQGLYLLSFLKSYAPNVNKHLKPLWEQKIPELITHLEEHKSDWREQTWEDLVLELLSATLSEVDEEKWSVGLGTELTESASLYTCYPEERAMLYKCLGVTMGHTTDKQYVDQQLDVILSLVRQHSATDSKASARAVGICARSHLDPVLSKLERFARDELMRKSSRLLSFMKDPKVVGEVERARLTLLLCYGEIALEAPGTELLPQLESGMTQWVMQQLQDPKQDMAIQLAAMRTLGNIAEALHPNRNSLQVKLSCRNELLHLVLGQFPAQQVYPYGKLAQLFSTILQVATALIKLPPLLISEERVTVLQTCFDKVYQTLATDTAAGDSNAGPLFWSQPELEILNCQSLLVQRLLVDCISPATLDEIFTLLELWLVQKDPRQRAAAMYTLAGLLQCYLDNMKFSYEMPSKFSQTGLILGKVVPRCTDPCMPVRRLAVDSTRLVLCLASRYEGHMSDYDNDLVSELARVQKHIQTTDPGALFLATGDLAKLICMKLPNQQLVHFSESLMAGLLDKESSSSIGTSIMLTFFLKIKGGELYHYVDDILSNILNRLANVKCKKTRGGTLRGVLALANHHPKAVVAALLRQPLPYSVCVAECWRTLAQDLVLAADIVDQFLKVLTTNPLYEDQPDKDQLRIAVLQPLAAISAIKELFRNTTMQDIGMKVFPELFSVLFIALGCYVGVSPPIYTPQLPAKRDKKTFIPNRNAYKLNPARVVQEAFQSFLLCCECASVAEALLKCHHMEAGDSLGSFINMVPLLTREVCSCQPRAIPKIVTCLHQYGTSIYEPQRTAVAAFHAEMVSLNGNGEVVLLESVMASLLNCLTDPAPAVRQLCLRGLACTAQLDAEQRSRYSEQVLAALVQGLDDNDTSCNIALEAVRGLSQVLPVVELRHIHSVQSTVALRMKPFFDRQNPSIREAAFTMFGDLARYGGTDSNLAFLEQVNGNLVCLLLHLDDTSSSVVKACKYTLRQVSPLLGAKRINSMMQNHLVDNANLHYYNFMADLAKNMVEELPEVVPALVQNSLSYMKSSWPVIRGNAVMFLGLMYGCLPTNTEIAVPLDVVCSKLMQLVKDDDPDVRAKAAKALSCLFSL